MRKLIYSFLFVVLAASPLIALHPGTSIVVPAAARGAGAGGSLWATSLYILNPGDTDVVVTISWLVRNQENPNPMEATREIAAGAAIVLEDPMLELFGLSEGGGAFLVTAPSEVVVNAGIFNRAGGQEFGQGFEGIPVEMAIPDGDTTHSIGVIHNADYRTNFLAVDATGAGSEIAVGLISETGQLLGESSYVLGAFEPILKSVGTISSDPVDAAVLRFEVLSGSVLVGGSRVNQGSGDPLTLAAWWPCGGAPAGGFAPVALGGLSFDAVVTPNECPIDLFTVTASIVFDSDDQATLTVNYDDDFSSTLTIPIASYIAAGNLGYVETSLPDWSISDTWITMIWTDSAGGRLTGASTDSDGSPMQVSGTFSLSSR